jgi:hypothetical protein
MNFNGVMLSQRQRDNLLLSNVPDANPEKIRNPVDRDFEPVLRAQQSPASPTLITSSTVLHPQLEDPIIIHHHPLSA